MTITISIIAIILSVASFGFTIYQYRKNSQININEKVNSLLKQIYELRRDIEDTRIRFGNTDDIPEFEDLLGGYADTIETVLKVFLENKKITIHGFFKLEQKCLAIHLEYDLLCKQINEVIRFNEESIAAGYDPIQLSED